MPQDDDKKPNTDTDTKQDLKKQAQEDEGLKKGYNEKNPEQPQGAFKPDAATDKN